MLLASTRRQCDATRDAWNYLTVQLARTSDDDDGDPDLYGMFTGGASGQVHC